MRVTDIPPAATAVGHLPLRVPGSHALLWLAAAVALDSLPIAAPLRCASQDSDEAGGGGTDVGADSDDEYEDEAERVFNEIDGDGSGEISFDEFATWCALGAHSPWWWARPS